jgi:fructose-1-phosphate kinase PfkB-like protein
MQKLQEDFSIPTIIVTLGKYGAICRNMDMDQVFYVNNKVLSGDIKSRIGAGDAFLSGIIWGIQQFETVDWKVVLKSAMQVASSKIKLPGLLMPTPREMNDFEIAVE